MNDLLIPRDVEGSVLDIDPLWNPTMFMGIQSCVVVHNGFCSNY